MSIRVALNHKTSYRYSRPVWLSPHGICGTLRQRLFGDVSPSGRRTPQRRGRLACLGERVRAGRGWVEFDPTNGIMASDGHITLAYGRDYDDVGPARGILLGGQRHWMDVSVDVVPIETEGD